MTTADAEAVSNSPALQKPQRHAEARFASLSASLLARKGEAEPALEPFAQARVAESARQMAPGERHEMSRRESFAPREGLTLGSDARDAQMRPAALREAQARGAEGAETKDCPRRRIGTSPRRAAVTFRMSIHDFLRLQLASAELERPAQEIILDALKAHLDSAGVESLDDCRCLKAAGEACAAPPPAAE